MLYLPSSATIKPFILSAIFTELLMRTYHIIPIRRVLICMCRSIVLFYVALIVGCESGCRHKKSNKIPESQFLLEKSSTHQPGNHSKETIEPDGLGDKKVKTLQRVAKVQKQVILLLHGLHRLSLDFKKMKEYLQKRFPAATILALKCVDKDPNKKGSFAPSPTMEFSIKDQAKKAYEEIKRKVSSGSHLVIVGHSQGGLRAFALVKEYGNRLKNECGIAIDHLITIGTPWKGAPVMDHIKKVRKFKQRFKEIDTTLDAIQKNYSKVVIKYFFKFMPGLAKTWPSLYEIAVPYFMGKKFLGAADLEPGSKFICDYVASGLKEIDVPITAIAGILTDFSKLFDSFPSSISKQALEKLNKTYAELIGGDPNCEHDMLLPVATQHAEGLVAKNFKRIKVYGACHGNKVGISVKRALSEINNNKVIQQVVECIEETFYQQKEEEVIKKGTENQRAA